MRTRLTIRILKCVFPGKPAAHPEALPGCQQLGTRKAEVDKVILGINTGKPLYIILLMFSQHQLWQHREVVLCFPGGGVPAHQCMILPPPAGSFPGTFCFSVVRSSV